VRCLEGTYLTLANFQIVILIYTYPLFLQTSSIFLFVPEILGSNINVNIFVLKYYPTQEFTQFLLFFSLSINFNVSVAAFTLLSCILNIFLMVKSFK
jgi:hypothetical protein